MKWLLGAEGNLACSCELQVALCWLSQINTPLRRITAQIPPCEGDMTELWLVRGRYRLDWLFLCRLLSVLLRAPPEASEPVSEKNISMSVHYCKSCFFKVIIANSWVLCKVKGKVQITLTEENQFQHLILPQRLRPAENQLQNWLVGCFCNALFA